MDVYRVGFRRLWEAVAEELATRAHTNGDALYRLTAKLLTAQDIFTGAMAVRYREEQTRVVCGERPSMTTHRVNPAGLLDVIGQRLGTTDWMTVTQQQVDLFAGRHR